MARPNKINRKAAKAVEQPAEESSSLGQAHLTTIERSTYEGPLPPSSELAKYNEILPNAAERIFAMAEANQAHRIEINRKTMELNEKHLELVAETRRSDVTTVRRGQVFASILSLPLIALAAFMVSVGASNAAAFVVITLLAILAGAYISGRRSDAKSNEKKSDSAPQ